MAAQKANRKPRTRRSTPNIRAVAPGQLLGYTLQETLLTHHLMDALPSSFLSIEVIDDLAITGPDNDVAAVQVKSALVTNPIADRSVQFWKTLHNWLQLIDDGTLQMERTRFILYVSRPTAGPIASSFSQVASLREAEAAIAEAKTQFWGEAPAYPKRAAISPALAEHLNPVLSDARTGGVLVRFQLQSGSGSPIGDFEATLEKQFLAQGQVKDLSSHALGWIRREIAVMLEQQKPAVVSRDRFYTEMNAFLRKISVQNILLSYARAPTEEEKRAELLKVYVRQLKLIELDDDDVLSAVTDFLKSSANRVEWGKQGLVHESSFDELDEALVSVWRNHRIGAKARYPSLPLDHGRCLYSDCMAHNAHLQGMATPDGFIRGCFHTLADGSKVGWHPDYQTLLKAARRAR